MTEESAAKQDPQAPGAPQRYPSPLALFVTIRSYDGSQVDVEVTLMRGGQLTVGLDGGDGSKPFRLDFPGPPDTKHWICGPGGIVPARPTFRSAACKTRDAVAE